MTSMPKNSTKSTRPGVGSSGKATKSTKALGRKSNNGHFNLKPKEEGEPSNERISEIIKQTHGRLTAASRYLNIDRATIYKRIKKHPELQEAVREARRFIVDFAEIQLMQNVRSKDQRAIEFVLKNKGKGWDQGSNDDGPRDLTAIINIFEAELAQTKPERLKGPTIIDVEKNANS